MFGPILFGACTFLNISKTRVLLSLEKLHIPEREVVVTSSSCASYAGGLTASGMAAVNNVSLTKLQSLNGIFSIYKKSGPTSADVLNTLKQMLLKGRQRSLLF